jgi:hypothetical protein
MKNPFRRQPKTDEQNALESVQQKTKAYPEKRGLWLHSTTTPVFDASGKVISTMTVYHGAHA